MGSRRAVPRAKVIRVAAPSGRVWPGSWELASFSSGLRKTARFGSLCGPFGANCQLSTSAISSGEWAECATIGATYLRSLRSSFVQVVPCAHPCWTPWISHPPLRHQTCIGLVQAVVTSLPLFFLLPYQAMDLRM